MKLKTIAITMVISGLLIGCQSKESAKLDMQETFAKLEGIKETQKMNQGMIDDVSYEFGINSSDIQEAKMLMPPSNIEAKEILLLELKSDSKKDEAIESINKRLKEKVKIFESYAPKEAKILKEAKVLDKGNYIFVSILENNDESCKIFEKSFE